MGSFHFMRCDSKDILPEEVTVTQKVAAPLEKTDAAQIVRDLSTWTVHEPDVKDLHYAITLQQKHQISLWDAIILQSANRLGCEIVWSEDLNHGQIYNSVELRNPFAR